MDTSILIGQSVKHVTYGSGKIAAINDKYIQIIFDRGESKRFQFPQVFVSYLKIEDASLMSEILMEEQKRIIADQSKKEKLINTSTGAHKKVLEQNKMGICLTGFANKTDCCNNYSNPFFVRL